MNRLLEGCTDDCAIGYTKGKCDSIKDVDEGGIRNGLFEGQEEGSKLGKEVGCPLGTKDSDDVGLVQG
eukprot:7686682-Ditylum_brightwellii.AAC.1